MGTIKDKKFERRKEQKQPLNPEGNTHQERKDFDIDEKTIKKQQHKE